MKTFLNPESDVPLKTRVLQAHYSFNGTHRILSIGMRSRAQ